MEWLVKTDVGLFVSKEIANNTSASGSISNHVKTIEAIELMQDTRLASPNVGRATITRNTILEIGRPMIEQC